MSYEPKAKILTITLGSMLQIGHKTLPTPYPCSFINDFAGFPIQDEIYFFFPKSGLK